MIIRSPTSHARYVPLIKLNELIRHLTEFEKRQPGMSTKRSGSNAKAIAREQRKWTVNVAAVSIHEDGDSYLALLEFTLPKTDIGARVQLLLLVLRITVSELIEFRLNGNERCKISKCMPGKIKNEIGDKIFSVTVEPSKPLETDNFRRWCV